MDEKLQKEVAQALANIQASQDFALGQIQALQAALGACFVALRSQPEFLAGVRQALEDHLAVVRQNETSLPMRDGVESTTRSLLRGMGEDQPGSVHTAPEGRLN